MGRSTAGVPVTRPRGATKSLGPNAQEAEAEPKGRLAISAQQEQKIP